MTKFKIIMLLLIIYLGSYISLNYNINLLYPYYLLKDLIMYPVYAITDNKELNLSDDLVKGINISLQEEIEELKKLNNLDISLTDFNYLNATVIERNRDFWLNEITIDKGIVDGINIDMAVIDSNGLIGRVSKVRRNSSDIVLLSTNNVNSKISIQIKGKHEVYGVTSGFDIQKNNLKAIINEVEDIEIGNKVYTTGMGGVFPKGILIGEVMDIEKENDDVTNVIYIRPFSNLKGVQYVSVLQRK